MADSFVQLPADGSGKRLRTFALPGGDHVEAVVLADTAGNLTSAPESPQFSALTSVGLASGASIDLDGTAITTGKTGQLMLATVSASVPLKAVFQKVVAGTPTVLAVLFTTDARLSEMFVPPLKSWVEVAGGATSRFRVTLTNQDTLDAADVYVSLFWDEVV